MHKNTELHVLRNFYYLSIVKILISSFVGYTAGSCLSYGHSCWGAHGKRSGLNFDIVDEKMTPPLNLGNQWLLAHILNRRVTQVPPRTGFRTRMLPELSIPAEIRHSDFMGKFSEDMNVKDSLIDELNMQKVIPSEVLLAAKRKGLNNNDDSAIKIGFFKIFKNIDDKLK